MLIKISKAQLIAIGMIFVWCLFGIVFANIVGNEDGYKRGFEEGKNYVPESMSKVDSSMVVYLKGYPQISDQVKMQRDSVQIVIDSFMGKPKKYLLMTLKLVTKEKE